MGLIDLLHNEDTWNTFFNKKREAGHLSKAELEDLSQFCGAKEYQATVERIRSGKGFNPPQKCLINKMYTEKKRMVYRYSREENYVQKLLTHLLIRKYDYLFAPNLYSFRVNTGVKRAMSILTQRGKTDNLYAYRTDISNYFNSIDVDLLLSQLKEVLRDDPELYIFLEGLLKNPLVVDEGKTVADLNKGAMAGSPLAAFFADVYLSDLDWELYHQGVLYARYSDDIILFAPSIEARDTAVKRIKTALSKRSLVVNPSKEKFYAPGDRWEFLGISYCQGVVDISDASLHKIKAKMRRKSRALVRWKNKKGANGIHAAKAFVRVFNRKMFENSHNNEMTWARWYFPLINTTDTLREIDAYFQDCLRYIATEKRNKGRFSFTYDEMKKLGYRSLVHEYYRLLKEEEEEKSAQEY